MPRLRIEVTATFAAGHEDDFRAWVAASAHNPFAFSAGDGVVRQMTVVGGAGGVAWRQVATAAGPPAWEVRMQLAGAEAAIV